MATYVWVIGCLHSAPSILASDFYIGTNLGNGGQTMSRLQFWCGIVARMTALFLPLALAPARAAEEPDLIFKRSTVLDWWCRGGVAARGARAAAAEGIRSPNLSRYDAASGGEGRVALAVDGIHPYSGFRAIQKIATIHASSIWKSQRRGLR
jgi:hypothetical protein